MRPFLCGLVLLCVAGLAATSKADTFEFTFVSLNGLIAGTGTISTLPFDAARMARYCPRFRDTS